MAIALVLLPACGVVIGAAIGKVPAGLLVGAIVASALAATLVAVSRSRLGGEASDDAGRGPAMTEPSAATETLRSVLDALGDPVIATDSSGMIVFANKAAEALLDRPGIVGRLVEDIFTQADLLGLHASAIAGAVRTIQIRLARRAGPRTFHVLGAPLAFAPREGQGPGRTGAVLAFRDVTEHAAAVQLKTDFVANASHELRTPLTSIRAAVETLAEVVGDDPVMVRRLALMITSNVARLEDLARDLLDLSRLESPETRVERGPVRAAEVAGTLAEIFQQPLGERRLSLRFDIAPEAEALDTDPRLVVLILKNLIENSTKFAYEGTTIAVGIAPADPASGEQRPAVRMTVTDRGMGIPLSHQSRIFERFYQGDPARSGQAVRRGTGLGLAIVKHAVKALGGTVTVSSVWKEGTTMTVELPDSVAPPAP